MTTEIDLTKNEKLELYHRISENNSEIDDILTVENKDFDTSNLDIQLIESLEWKPEKGGEYTFEINGKEHIVKINDVFDKNEEQMSLLYNIENGSGDNINDNISSNDGTLSGPSWKNGGYKNYYINFDNEGENKLQKPNFDFTVDGTKSFSWMWIIRPLDNYDERRASYWKDDTEIRFGYGASSGDIQVQNDEFAFIVNEDVWYGSKVNAPTQDLGEWQM